MLSMPTLYHDHCLSDKPSLLSIISLSTSSLPNHHLSTASTVHNFHIRNGTSLLAGCAVALNHVLSGLFSISQEQKYKEKVGQLGMPKLATVCPIQSKGCFVIPCSLACRPKLLEQNSSSVSSTLSTQHRNS